MATYEKFEDGKSKDISDEPPFDLPQGWAWARLSDLTDSSVLNDGDWIVSSDMSENGNVKLLQLGSVGNGIYENKGFKYITEAKFRELGCTEIHQGYLLINRMIGDNLLACILPPIEGKVITAVDVCWIAPSDRYDVKWLLFLVLSQWFQKKAKSLGAGEGRVRISKGNLVKIVFPMPPLSEQKRIVARVEELFAYAATLEEATDDIGKTAERIDKKVLDLAIRGQLVPQDPSDEPASELLKRLEAAKRAKAGGRVSSRAASDRPAYEIDPPFDIPNSWEWVSLGEICSAISKGSTPKGGSKAYTASGVLFIRAENVCSDGNLRTETAKYIHEQIHCHELGRSILEEGDLLITIAGSLGRSAIVSSDVLPANTNQAVAFARPCDKELSPYLKLAIMSGVVQSMLLSQKKVTGIPNLTLEIVSNLRVPLPPLAEQKRIVAKIEELRAMTKSLTT